MSTPAKVRTVLEAAPLATPLKQGVVTSPLVELDFVEVEVIHKAFAPMVRDAKFDISELAIVTALQAIAFKRPIKNSARSRRANPCPGKLG